MELFPFQIDASTQIAERFAIYAQNPLTITRTHLIPFYQNLNSITGSGKTLILADTIAQIRLHLPIEPIVLWLSNGKVVVWQTYTNLSSGKYTDLVSGFTVKPLMDCKQSDVENPSSSLILVATVGKFNQKDKEVGDRKIYQLALDFADMSLWERLKKRRTLSGQRRPFIIVYDEGHNLSNQQTELLLELEPDALIAASATTRVPEALSNTISRLRSDKKWTDADFATVVKSSDVVQSGLVKQHILLGGYITPMEIAIDEMLDNMRRVETASETLNLTFKPKAIYVSNTNMVSGKGNTDTLLAPFEERQARPILIWRHLVENRGVDPSTIAAYCDLTFDPKFPPPPKFKLFTGGDADYDNFIAGNYQHIIFNRILQEGWDDPTCYFAYIDKEMGSKDQITQIVGRVLRQPLAQHYSDPSLNTAYFYIRTDEKSVFEDVLQEVRDKITADSPEISLTVFTGGKGASGKTTLQPRRVKQLPDVDINSPHALEAIKKLQASIPDYRAEGVNTIGKGGRIQVLQTIGIQGNEQQEWIELEHSNRVTARWVFTREVQKAYPKAVNLCDLEDKKFDALIEYNSIAAEQIREAARRIVTAYVANSTVTHNFLSPKDVPAILVDPSKLEKFTFAIHEGYSDLNGFELEFARALDKTQRVWFRNPSKGVFEIPLLTKGGTRNFNPDFIVWVENRIIAIDPKADHLIVDDAGRKLLHIKKIGSGPDLTIRLVTRGKWNDHINREDSRGFTVWVLRSGKAHPLLAETAAEAVQFCLRSDE